MRSSETFWTELERLTSTSPIVVDRPKGYEHPRWPGAIYPFDYGYLEGTTGGDGHPVDVWIGSQAGATVTGMVCTLDLDKKDVEIKVLLGCSAEERQTILAFHSHPKGAQHAVLVERDGQTVSPRG